MDTALHERQTQQLVNAMATFQLDGTVETRLHMRPLPGYWDDNYLINPQLHASQRRRYTAASTTIRWRHLKIESSQMS
jgi:hypothetical protein